MAQPLNQVSFEGKLPPELRNHIYHCVLETDVAHIARKTLRGKYIFSSRRLRHFSSANLQREYRDLLAEKMLGPRAQVTAVVQDFGFRNVIEYLRQRESKGALGSFLQRDGVQRDRTSRLYIVLKFSKKFDGSTDRATTWANFTKQLAKKYGTGLHTTYSVFPAKGVPAMARFKSGLRLDQDLDPECEWAKMLKAFKEAFTPVIPPRGPSTAERQRMEREARRQRERDADRAWEQRISDLVAAGIDPDELDDEDGEEGEDEENDPAPNVLPPDNMELWGGDAWAKELLGGKSTVASEKVLACANSCR